MNRRKVEARVKASFTLFNQTARGVSCNRLIPRSDDYLTARGFHPGGSESIVNLESI